MIGSEFLWGLYQQWLGIDELSDKFADGTLKLTICQAFQLHDFKIESQANNERD